MSNQRERKRDRQAERDRERERERERKTDREREGERERERERQTGRERQGEREKERERKRGERERGRERKKERERGGERERGREKRKKTETLIILSKNNITLVSLNKRVFEILPWMQSSWKCRQGGGAGGGGVLGVLTIFFRGGYLGLSENLRGPIFVYNCICLAKFLNINPHPHHHTVNRCGGIMSHKLLCRIEKNRSNVEIVKIGIVSQFFNVAIFNDINYLIVF
jgi:hypothetical protein